MKIIDLELYSADLAQTRLFYVRRLGLPVLSCSSEHLTVLIGWTHLTFRLTNQPVAPYHLAINVPRGSLEVIMYYFDLEYLDTQAPEKTIADFSDWRARACYFYESPASPETSNLLEFIARTDLPLDDPNLTINELFQGVSEIGIGTEDVLYTTAQIQRRFGVPQFSRSVPAPDFNALGDDNGLFILSRAGRRWLFSNTPTGLNYCRVRFITNSCTASGLDVIQEFVTYEVNQLPIGYSLTCPSIS